MAQVIGAELHLETLRRAHQGAGHDAGIIDQQVDLRVACDGRLRTAAHAVEIGQVHHQQVERRTGHGCQYLLAHRPQLGLVPGRHDHLRTRGGQHPYGLHAQARGRAGDQRPFSLQ